MFSYFILLSLLSCVIANEIMYYIGEIVDDSGSVKTKKGQLCYGTVILPFTMVTTCSCAVQFGGKIKNKVIKLDGKTKFKLPSRKDGGSTLNDITSVGIHKDCHDSGKIWAFDVAIAKLKNEIFEVFIEQDFPYKTGEKCELFKMPSFEISPVDIVAFAEGNCHIPPSNKEEEMYLEIWNTCITGANCKYGIGTPIICGKSMSGIMVSQDCTKNQNSTAINFIILSQVSGYTALTIDDILKVSGESSASSLTIYSPILFISSFYIFK